MPAFQGEGLGRTFVRELLERNHERVVVRAAIGRYVGHNELELF